MSPGNLPWPVDLESLLAPISGERPSGESLRYAGVYDAIREARREDEAGLPQGVWKTELKRADWGAVAMICLEALETRSKDLQIAAWLAEAWIHLHGAAGLTQGLRLVASLAEAFWDTLHPLPDPDAGDEGLEIRLSPVEWMAARLPETVKGIAVTRPEDRDGSPYSLNDWEAAWRRENLARMQGAPVSDDGVTTEKFLVSASLTPTPFYAALLDELRRSREALGALADVLAGRAGQDAPSLQPLAGAIEAMQHLGMQVLRDREERGEIVAPARQTGGPEDGGGGSWEPEWEDDDVEPLPSMSSSGPVASRADAYRRLNEAAEYLLRTEPHSPTPYLVRRAVAWGNMTLAELLQELVQSDTDLRAIYTLLGIRERP